MMGFGAHLLKYVVKACLHGLCLALTGKWVKAP